MAKTVTLQGATYNDVPAIIVPSQTLLASYKAMTYSSASSGGYAYSLVGEVTTNWLYEDGIIVNYDGSEYLLPYTGVTSNYYGYGAPMSGSNINFTNYPIRVESDEEAGGSGKNWYVYCQTNGSHSLSVTSNETAKFNEVSDTTASAGDVASGKYFYTSDGVLTQGTNSGGGGASNYIQGSFTANTASGVQTINLSYTGSGYPICAMVFVKGGAYDSANTTWYNSMQRYAVGQWTMHKSVQSTTPSYATSGSQNYAVTTAIYKNSTSSSTSYTRTSAMNSNTFSSSNASGSAALCCRFKNAKTLTVYVAASSYGLLAGLEYEYHIVYSS